MSAADLLLTVRGQDDRWLSMAPDRTYFEAKYQPRVNRSRETYEIPFDNQDATFGTTGRCTIPVKGDYMTRVTLRTVLPPIYPTVPGQYVYPTPSSEVGATVYVNKVLDLVVADGVTLTANTVGNHYFSIGAQVTLAGTAYVIFDLDGTYTITGIPTANSFTCSTTLAGISYNGTVSSPGIQCGDIISYFSTTNSNLWVNNLTNKTWQITAGSNVGTSWTFTTSAPSNFPIGSQVVLNLAGSGVLNETFTVTASTDTTFTITKDTGNHIFVLVGGPSYQGYSTDNGLTWTSVSSPVSNPDINNNIHEWYSVASGNGVFVMSGDTGLAYSSDNGRSWKLFTQPSVSFPDVIVGQRIAFGNGVFVSSTNAIAFGNGVFVIVGDNYQAYSTDNGLTWTSVASPIGGSWSSVAYGNGVFVAVGAIAIQAYSTDNGLTWTPVMSPVYMGGFTHPPDVAFGNGVFVAVGGNESLAYSTDNGLTWTLSDPIPPYGLDWVDVSFGNGVFIAVDYSNFTAYSTDNGLSWTISSQVLMGGFGGRTAYAEFSYTTSLSDSVSLVVPPLQLANRVFSSDVYPSISFANAADAAFWGFDSREGLIYALPATPPWTLTQSGWISGFLPPSTSTYDDSVAHKLCKAVRILVGKQTIKEYSGEYIELQNDLLVPYENKAILKLMNGTLDQTQATVAREYYVNFPLGTKEVPLCALTHQHMSVEVDFDSYLNVSQNLNAGTGDFLDAKSYTTYDASTGLLNGQPIDVQTTFSYQQYIFIVTYGGQFIIFDTTKNVDDPASYIVLSAFSGSSLFSQFCVLSGNLYIGLTDGQLARMIITELIQGNLSSFTVNNYTPTIGSLTGTIIADFRYVYYTVSNTASSNVFLSRYDTSGVFTNAASYTTVGFTETFDSGVTGVYQTLSTGTELIVLPQGTPGKIYTYQLNANVQSQWYVLDYSSYGTLITEGVVIGSTVYFVADLYKIIVYSDLQFTTKSLFQNQTTFVDVGYYESAYSTDNGKTWTQVYSPLSGYYPWLDVTAGKNGVFVAVTFDNQMYSHDNGRSWTPVASPLFGYWYSVAYGNGIFVMIQVFGELQVARSFDNGQTWTTSILPVLPIGDWRSVTFGNGIFVIVGINNQAYSTDNGETWTTAATPVTGEWRIVRYGNGVFVATNTDTRIARSVDGTNWAITRY
jgi:hypothetical protein